MHLDAFKCFCCGNHFAGTELGGTTHYPYGGFTEYYCKTCKGPSVTPPPKVKKQFTFTSGIRKLVITATTIHAAKLALAVQIADAWTDPAWNWKVEETRI